MDSGLCSLKTRQEKGYADPPCKCMRVYVGVCVCDQLIGLYTVAPRAFIQVGGRM